MHFTDINHSEHFPSLLMWQNLGVICFVLVSKEIKTVLSVKSVAVFELNIM